MAVPAPRREASTRTIEQVPPTQQPGRDVARGIAARAVQIGVVFLVIGVVLFGAARRLDWIWGWVCLGIYLASTLVNASFLRHNPELVAERGEPGAMPTRDKALGGLWSLAQFVLVPLVAGLDVRFGWAMIANAYFSTVARIQRERGQTVCREGPYRFVRQPGYAGAILQSIGSPLLLGSLCALIPAVTAGALMVARTWCEDRMLMTELPGYPEYARQVRQRLALGIW